MLAATAAARTSAGKPIVIGWAFDAKGAMAPFTGRPLRRRAPVAQVNAKGGVNGRPLASRHATRRTTSLQCRRRARTSSSPEGHVLFTTCDVDYAAPAVQEASTTDC